jgi:hypothetical protein
LLAAVGTEIRSQRWLADAAFFNLIIYYPELLQAKVKKIILLSIYEVRCLGVILTNFYVFELESY